jgi:nitroreductase
VSHSDYFVPYSVSDEGMKDLDEEILLTQVRVWGHWLDKEMQLSASRKVEFSPAHLHRLSCLLPCYRDRFAKPKPEISWAEQIKAMYENALRDPVRFRYEWQAKPSLEIGPEEMEKAIRSRRSIRHFRKEKISRTLLLKLIDCARWAPTNCNQQSLRFIVVGDPIVLRQLEKGGMRGGMSPCVIATVADLRFYGENDAESPAHDSGAALENLLLMAHAHGLGACYTSSRHVNCDLHRAILKVKDYEKITALVWLGYYDSHPISPAIREIEEIVQFL